MSRELIHINYRFNVPAEKVWDFFNDHNRFSEILPGKVYRIVDSKDIDNVNGIGSVRKIDIPFAPLEETIVRSKRPTLIEYTITRGGPLKHHFGTINIIPIDNKSSILDYTIELEADNPITVFTLKWVLELVISDGVKKLSKSFENNPNYA